MHHAGGDARRPLLLDEGRYLRLELLCRSLYRSQVVLAFFHYALSLSVSAPGAGPNSHMLAGSGYLF